MEIFFANNLKKFRTAKGLSQQELAEKIFVTRSTVARWENGTRLPDALMLSRLSKILETDVNSLIFSAKTEKFPNIIMVDDRKIFLAGALPILEEVFPTAIITGFTRPSEAIEFAKINLISLAFLDIEMGGKINGLNLCKILLKINPRTNVIFLTNYVEYSFDAWSTGASGFILKPISSEKIREILKNLRYPFDFGGKF